MKKVLLVCTVILLLAGGVSRAQIIITEQPDTMITKSGDYALGGNLINCSLNGIIIKADNVTLDGRGYVIDGIDDSRTGIFVQGNNVEIKNCEIQGFKKGISLHKSVNCKVVYNIITNPDGYGIYRNSGIYLYNDRDSKISNNTVTGRVYAIYLCGSTGDKIFSNTIKENSNGIYLDGSNKNEVRDNIVSFNWDNGILLCHSNNNSIFSNITTDNANGIKLSIYNYYNKIYDNKGPRNKRYGIALIHWCDDNRNDGNHGSNNIIFGKVNNSKGTTDYNNKIENLAGSYILYQNYPNPFNSSTMIDFLVAKTGWIKLTVFNALGQKIVTLVNEYYQAGHHTIVWDGRDNTGLRVGSGIYYYRMVADDFCETKKMAIVK